MPRAFAEISTLLTWDGALRDFSIGGVAEADWNRFITAIPKLTEGHEFRHDKDVREMPRSFEEIKRLQQDSSTVLSLVVSGKVLNCHFFDSSEIELDFWPTDYNTPDSWMRLLEFFQKIVDLTGKRGIITQENVRDEVIDELQPQAVA